MNLSRESRREPCIGCGARFDPIEGPTHRYMRSSAACWAAFGNILAADYADAGRMRFHQLVVDAYACQHPGEPGRVTAQSVGMHLMTLALFCEFDADPALGTELHRRMVGAASVWEAWSMHHDQVRAWLADVQLLPTR